ncbi:MAG: hypothetical protein JKY34_09290 [Kordiimonadaceae bacterium]|nr:hypothetical protein [Kordiimonadaceae bacterium]
MDFGILGWIVLLSLPVAIGAGVNAKIKKKMKSYSHERGFILRTNAYAATAYFLLILFATSFSQPDFARDLLIIFTILLIFALMSAAFMVPSFLIDLFLRRREGKKFTAEEFK